MNIWLVEGGDEEVTGDVMTADSIDVKYETVIKLEILRTKLNEVAAQHLEQHLKTGKENWDYKKSFEEFCADMPITKSPIILTSGSKPLDEKLPATILENENNKDVGDIDKLLRLDY